MSLLAGVNLTEIQRTLAGLGGLPENDPRPLVGGASKPRPGGASPETAP